MYIKAGKVEGLQHYLQAANRRQERTDTSVFLSVFRLLDGDLPVTGFGGSNCRKYAAAMTVACNWDIHPAYLDHFVQQMGGWEKMRKDVAEKDKPGWVEGLTSRFRNKRGSESD